MKRTLTAVITAILCVITANAYAYAEESAKWKQDDPGINIYDAGSISDEFCVVQMENAEGNWVTVDLLTPGSPIRLLMINGGFVPGAQIIVQNNRTLVPVRIISEVLGAKVDWDGNKRTVTVTGAGTFIILTIDSSQAAVNGQKVTLDAPATIFSDKTYVPLRFIAEALNAQVGYTDKFNDAAGSLLNNYQISMVTIEKSADKPKYAVNDGLAAVKDASAATYQTVANYLKQTDRTFSDSYPNYDPQKITYVNSFGRYYVYRLEGFEYFNILYNSYTGEIFSQQPGLPFLFIGKGFISIEWLYQ